MIHGLLVLSVFRLDRQTRDYIADRMRRTTDNSDSRTLFTLSKIYQLAMIPKEHQLVMAKAVVELKHSMPAISKVLQARRAGIRGKDIRIRRPDLEASHAALERASAS